VVVTFKVEPSSKLIILWTNPFPKEVSPNTITLLRLSLMAPVRISAEEAVPLLIRITVGTLAKLAGPSAL